MIKFNNYKLKIRLLRSMLGTNPSNPNVMDTHILDRQRKLIAEKSNINKAVNKYLDAKTISEEQGKAELEKLRLRIETVLGEPLTDDEFNEMVEGKFKKFTDLKETLSELDEKGITCFFRDSKGWPVISSHMILGFMKAAADAYTKTQKPKNGTVLRSSSYTCSIINQHVGMVEQFLPASQDVIKDEEGKPKYYQRSLRAMTAQGPRISLAKSEELAAGTEFEFTLKVLDGSALTEKHIKTIFSYGQLKGLGQFRNSDFGTFEVIDFVKL